MVNNLTLAWTHGCIPAVSIVEGKNDVLVNLQETLCYDVIILCLVTHQTLPLLCAVEESENKLTLSWSSKARSEAKLCTFFR